MKRIKALAIGVLLITTLTGCNKTIVDFNYTYNYAVIQLPNGEIVEGKVQEWTDYEGEQLQIKIDNIVYLCSSYNCVLMKK